MEKFRLFIVDLMNVDDSSVLFGRENFEYIDFNTNIIVIDSIVSDTRALVDSFDSVNDKGIFTTVVRYTTTVDFFGKDATESANKFLALCRSQLALDLSAKYKITPHTSISYQNLKILSGTDYENRIQLTLYVDDCLSFDTPLYALETSNTDYLIEE